MCWKKKGGGGAGGYIKGSQYSHNLKKKQQQPNKQRTNLNTKCKRNTSDFFLLMAESCNRLVTPLADRQNSKSRIDIVFFNLFFFYLSALKEAGGVV
jgi:hypothetical protein